MESLRCDDWGLVVTGPGSGIGPGCVKSLARRREGTGERSCTSESLFDDLDQVMGNGSWRLQNPHHHLATVTRALSAPIEHLGQKGSLS